MPIFLVVVDDATKADVGNKELVPSPATNARNSLQIIDMNAGIVYRERSIQNGSFGKVEQYNVS
jgi:hypothetical protein